MQPYAAYYRVSTAKQGKSGLGLDAQRAACSVYNPIAEFVEIESGKNDDRAQLQAALAYCRAMGARLVVAKLDRLSRDVEFIARTMKQDVPIRCADMPDADEFQLHLFAALAHKERRMISERTKAAIAVKRERGEEWGTNRAKTDRSNTHAASVFPHIQSAIQCGRKSLASVAAYLNERAVRTSKGAEFTPMQVKRIIDKCSCS